MGRFLVFVFFLISIASSAQKAEVFYDHARVHYDLREYKEALKDVDHAIDKSRNFYDAYLLRAKIYYGMGEKQKALDQLTQITQDFSTADRAYFQRGLIYYDDENYEKALPEFEKATEGYDGDAEYFYYLGEAALETEDLPKACTAWNTGAHQLEDEDCKDLFDEHCEGVELIEPEPTETNNPFEFLKKK